MFKWFLNALERNGRKLVIMDRDDKEQYLNRWYVAYPDSVMRERKDIKFNTFVHQFMASDDPVFHNHPWLWYHTIILKGGYWEHTPWGTFWRGPGHMRRVIGNKWVPYQQANMVAPVLIPSDLHWVEVPKSGETWTLFTRGRNHGWDWGFVPNPETGQWTQHQEYLASVRKA